MSKVLDKEYVLLLIRVKFENNQIITLNNMQTINNDPLLKDNLITYIKDRLALSNESYKVTPIISIIFSYGIREGKYKLSLTPNPSINKGINYQIYYKNELPIAMLPKDYGVILSQIGNTYTISVNRGKSKAIIILTVKKIKGQTINHIRYIKNNNLLFSWTDTLISLDEKKFIRNIGKSILHFENGELSLFTSIKKSKPMAPKVLKKNNKLNSKFITMDLETLNINNILIPYLLCWYNNGKTHSYFITNPEELKDLTSNSSETLDQHVLAMILDAMKDICKRKYKNYKIYMHNFSRFDGYFLVKYLSQLGYCGPIINKGKIISCKFTLYETNTNVTFMDSFLLLPSSLRDLSESFQVDNPKSFFPFKITDINYSGSVPDIKLFDNISSDDYEKYKESYKNKIWNFKEESVKYCNIDCISLFQILDKFNQLIFNKFKLNIVNYPTLPSLAFGLFRTHYLKKDSIHMLSGKLADDIRSGYTGGAVDMYIPNGTNIHVYDVNSLYPFVMRDKKMPIGTHTYFQGNILKVDPNAFGFFYCKIKAPDNLKHPILQTHLKTKNGLRTVAPLGTWEGMYFSEELYNAEKFGYKFDILWGYTFDKDFIFKDYINDLYNLRLSYPKTDTMNMTAKLLLNSLYGRFGMDDAFTPKGTLRLWVKKTI